MIKIKVESEPTEELQRLEKVFHQQARELQSMAAQIRKELKRRQKQQRAGGDALPQSGTASYSESLSYAPTA